MMSLIPFGWLKKNISFPINIQSKSIAKKLTELGLETEINKEICHFTPLPNRLDLLTWWGIAQEISILLNYPLTLSFNDQSLENEKDDQIKVISETNKCSQIQLVLINNIKIQPSQQWIKDYLKSNNINSINNVVDLANLVMLETGQPLHIHDYDKIVNPKEITVRQAVNGEKILTLSDQEIALTSEDTVVSSGKETIGLGGIIGCQKTSVNEKTTRLLVELLSLDNKSIKSTSGRLGIITQASQYFSKKINLPFGKFSLWRLIELIKEIGQIQGEIRPIIWTAKKPTKSRIISINHEFIEKKLGIKLSSQKVENLLRRLNFSYQKKINAT